MKRAAMVAGLTLAVAGPVLAQCPVPEPAASAKGWQVVAGGNGHVATSSRYPKLEIALDMHSPGRPEILYWRALPRYGRRIGVMRFFAGEPGTSYLVTLVDQVVVDLESGREIGRGTWSADCEPVTWIWTDDRVEVDDPGFGQQVFSLP